MRVAKPYPDVLVTIRQVRPKGVDKAAFKPQVKKIPLYETSVDEAASVVEKAIYETTKEATPQAAEAPKPQIATQQKQGSKK